MGEFCKEGFEVVKVDKREFVPASFDDEVRVDRLCKDLLHRFYEEAMESGMSPEEATTLASGADYFIRDFVVSIKGRSIFEERAGIVRQFAGNWYIINTMEPLVSEIDRFLAGIRAFYRFLYGHQLISLKFLQAIEAECAERDYYEARIESFWAITGDGYLAWEKECSLKDA